MTRRDHALLIGDGFLLTLGTATLAIAVAFALSALEMPSGRAQLFLELGSSLLLLGAGIAGVVLAWRLNGRKVEGRTVVGGIAGAIAGGGSMFVLALLSWVLGLPLRLVTDWEYAGPVATLVLVSIAVTAVTVWLSADAVRDLAAHRRAHIGLDRARIASMAVFAALVAVSLYLVFAQPGPEQGEAPIWAIAGGLVGAGAIAGADLATVATSANRA